MTKMNEIGERQELEHPNGDNDGRSLTGIREVLLPTDLPMENREVIHYAVTLARTWNARLTLLHIYKEPYNLCYLRGLYAYDAIKRHRQHKKEMLQQLGDEVREQYPKCTTEFREGTLSEEIVRAANDLQADLMIVGTHANNWFQRIAYGSDADVIARWAPCPVLVVGEHEHDFVSLN